MRIGQVDQIERRSRSVAEPAFEKRHNRVDGPRGPCLQRCFILRQDPEGGVGAVVQRADGDEEAGCVKAEIGGWAFGLRDVGDFVVKAARGGLSERDHVAVDERHRGCAAVG